MGNCRRRKYQNKDVWGMTIEKNIETKTCEDCHRGKHQKKNTIDAGVIDNDIATSR